MMSDFADDGNSSKSIVNTGPGVAIGRDNYGTINAPIDDTTKRILAKLATEAPDLARVVRTALDKGVVPPGLVYALERAAWAINEDVALMIQGAAQSINEDVASMLQRTASNLNEDVDRLERVADQIDKQAEAATQLNSGTSEFRSLIERIEQESNSLAEVQQAYTGYGVVHQLDQIATRIEHHSGIIERVIEPPPAQIVVNWRPTLWAFFIGVIVGITFLAVAIHR